MAEKTTKSKKTLDAKTSSPKNAKVSKKEKTDEIASAKEIQKKKVSTPKIKRNQVIVIALILLIVGVLFYFKGLFIAALVDGQPISRISLIKEMEKQSGKQTLNSLITQALIQQAASKQNIKVGNDEVDQEVKKISDTLEKRGQKLDQLLLTQGTTMVEFREQIRIQKLVEKLIGKDIKVDDKEINDYIEKNKESIPQDAKPEEVRSSIKQQLEQQKLSEKFQVWLDDLKAKAKITYFVNY